MLITFEARQKCDVSNKRYIEIFKLLIAEGI